MAMVCRLPRATILNSAANPLAVTSALNCPSLARPSTPPLMPRLASLQCPGQAAPTVGDVAREIEFVAVAGAAQHLLQIVAFGRDSVGRLATDALAGAVADLDHAGAGPCALKAPERASRLGVARRRGRRDAWTITQAAVMICRKNFN